MTYGKYSLYAHYYAGETLYCERLHQANTKKELTERAKDFMRTRPEYFDFFIDVNNDYKANH